MIAVRGRIENGVAHPEEPLDGHEGQEVIITVLDEHVPSVPKDAPVSLSEIVDRWKTDTGIPDLAHQHDHYLYGTPKRD